MSQTLFTKVDFTLGALVDQIASGQLGLPDIQRPFVWRASKVRDLFDSMFRGYPVGYFLFWAVGVQPGTRQIGTHATQVAPSRLIVDGQQRLTSLFAVIRGVPVVRDDYTAARIEIAFNPLEDRFEVADAAIRRNPAFIADISDVWSPHTNLFQFAEAYLEKLRASRSLSKADTDRIQRALGRLHALTHYPFTALELAADVQAEHVSDVFVRINSQGKSLNQADFILTLMSVFWDEGRSALESFCRRARTPSDGTASPYNPLFQPAPSQLLRVAVAVGFRRARLSATYAVLRGRTDEGQSTTDAPEQHFAPLKSGQAAVLDLTNWHDFLGCIATAGYRSAESISSENALIFAYALYLIGRKDFAVERQTLRRVIARWFFMSSLTGRYTGSPESQFEFDLTRLRGLRGSEAFVGELETIGSETLTNDFWTITLPADLATSSPRSPSMLAFYAALIVLDAPALYSDRSVRDLADPAVRGPRRSLERHHLFPKAYLAGLGIDDPRDYNQIANFTVIEWGDNIALAAQAPADYAPAMEARVAAHRLPEMYRLHALPDGWAMMDFSTFLRARRTLMARTIRAGFDALAGETRARPHKPSVAEIVAAGETGAVEFKSTLRTNLHTGQHDPRMEMAVLKTIAGFLNSGGGRLVIGIADDGTPIGLDPDRFPSEDRMVLHLVNLLRDRLGAQYAMYIEPNFSDHEGVTVLTVTCLPSASPVFVKDGQIERFFVRYGPSTQELSGQAAQDFIRKRF